MCVQDEDDQMKESASKYSVYGIHGQISEYLTTKTLVRQIYPPQPTKPKVSSKAKLVKLGKTV